MKNLNKSKANSPLLDVLMEYCDEMITVKSLDFKYLDCNRAFLNHLGLKNREDVLGKTIFEVLPPRNIDLIKKNIGIVIQTGKLQSYSFKIITNNSSRVVQQIATPIIQNNEIKYILAISRDITQDEIMKNELITKNNQFNTLMEHLPLMVYMKDKDRNYITGSKYAKEFVENGYDPHAKNIQINMENCTKDTQAEDEYVLQNKKLLVKEKKALDCDGQTHWYNVLKAPIVKEDNSIDGLVTIARNIDSQKEVENQKDLFIATLVHDLKNPLLAQISSMDLLAKGYFGKLSDEQNELLAIILESANYMKDMLYTLINTYKYDNGSIILSKSKTDINKIIKTCIREHSSLAKEHSIKINYKNTLKGDDNFLMCDEKQIRRVITNLLNNGINYAFENSEFNIITKLENNKIKIELTNNGPQMDEETKAHLFEKYISGANKYQKVGFGLGMYLSKKVMEAHDGDIYHLGEGTVNCFVLELPVISENKAGKINW